MAGKADNSFMGYAITIAVVIILIAVFLWAMQRSKRKAASARLRASAAEAELMATAEQLTRSIVVEEDPEKEAAKARVAAIWGNKQAERDAALSMDRLYGTNEQHNSGVPEFTASPDNPVIDSPVFLLPAMPEPPRPAATGAPGGIGVTPLPAQASPSPEEASSVAGEIASRLHLAADKVRKIDQSSLTDQEKADQITLLLAREWSALPLDRLQGAPFIR